MCHLPQADEWATQPRVAARLCEPGLLKGVGVTLSDFSGRDPCTRAVLRSSDMPGQNRRPGHNAACAEGVELRRVKEGGPKLRCSHSVDRRKLEFSDSGLSARAGWKASRAVMLWRISCPIRTRSKPGP